MGNVEKWVVLGVLALIVGILVVSLNVDDPLRKEKAVLARGPDAPADASSKSSRNEAPKPDSRLPAENGADAGKAPRSALLNTSVHPTASGAAGDTKSAVSPSPSLSGQVPNGQVPNGQVPNGSILKTMDDLQESYMSDAMFYTWKAGDTFPDLARRFYGDPSRLATLKRLNEGRTEVQPGERVLIPVYDLDATQSPAIPAAPLVERASEKAGSSAARKVDAPAKPEVLPQAASTSGPRYHLVKDGENLWKIAKQELGSGSRWNEIYSANRDVLSSPEALHTGQKLRVP
jgi:nucleoid-associated protein YgaU